MENNRGQSIFLSVVGIATLLVAIIGATFAYFSITVTGNDTASSIQVTTAKVGGVTFDGTGAGVVVTNAYPGWSASKTFTIASDASVDANSEISYQIILHTTNAELPSLANTTVDDFVYSLAYHNGPYAGNGQVSADVSKAAVPTSTGDVTIGTGKLKGTETHTWDFTVQLEESGSDQNHLQGKTYEGIIQIVVGGANGELRTWDDVGSSWKIWTAGDNTVTRP